MRNADIMRNLAREYIELNTIFGDFVHHDQIKK